MNGPAPSGAQLSLLKRWLREPTAEEGYDAPAAAHSRAIARLSRGIPDALRALDRSGE